MRVLVCGGRDFADAKLLHETLDRLPVTHLIHGGARGADTMAHNWACGWRQIPITVYPADWRKHGWAAGARRNQEMIDKGRPELVVAFPGGNGTADMVARAERHGIWVIQPMGGKKP